MSKIFSNNLLSLLQANTVIIIYAASFSIFYLFVEKNFVKAAFTFSSAVIALILALSANYRIQKEHINDKAIYVLITLFYANIMILSIYLCVWSTPDKLATIFLFFLICALLMFVNPPLFNFCLTLGAIVVFIISTIILKSSENSIHDVVNSLVAGFASLYFSWHITKLRLGLELSANMLEEERNKYFDQSTIDELTQLNNRRDFKHTFQRYLSNYRTSDDWLCIAIIDIDFFKFFNDHYGHPKGDDCLRAVGAVLNSLKESMGVYAARVGGEEFALLWFEKEASHADTIATNVGQLIGELKIPHEKSKVAPFVTISIGVYVIRCGTSTDAQILYDFADKALYTAKNSGRNCAIISGSEFEERKVTPALSF